MVVVEEEEEEVVVVVVVVVGGGGGGGGGWEHDGCSEVYVHRRCVQLPNFNPFACISISDSHVPMKTTILFPNRRRKSRNTSLFSHEQPNVTHFHVLV
jgi:hypothetical protein